ncbi:hypothetical protein H9P43_007779 [Blastocladiella emersonii ATCC 22665]|nr:hypothetical protein H9P43_007779 [Blastocladiella emersonii ATCC 22665]
MNSPVDDQRPLTRPSTSAAAGGVSRPAGPAYGATSGPALQQLGDEDDDDFIDYGSIADMTRGPMFRGVPVIRLANFACLVAVLVMNYIAGSTTWLNGNRTGDVSRLFPNYLVPAGYAFSIWPVIYTFLTLFGVYQLSPATYNSSAINEAVGYLFPLNAVGNIAWLVVWAYRVSAMSVILLLWSFGTVFAIYARLKSKYPSPRWSVYLAVHVPFSLYAAWSLGACVINVYAVTTTRDEAFIPPSVAGLVFLAAVQAGVAVWARDPLVAGVATWTLIGNYVRNHDVELIGVTALILFILAAVLTVALTVANAVLRRRGRFVTLS